MPELPELIPVVRAALGTLLSWILGKTSAPDLSGLAAAINTVWEAVQVVVRSIVRVRTQDKEAAGMIGNFINDVGGAVQEVGDNQHDLWHHLRYTLMPNTIDLIWTYVFNVWIWPIHDYLRRLRYFQALWNNTTRSYAWELKNWSHSIIARQRDHRARFVYPQLRWLMSPQRVAYHYVQAILTEIGQYLAYAGHHGDRDAITRAVIDTSPRLWRHTEQAILAFLQQPIDSTGRGAPLPQRPTWAKQPPPLVPPIWEPWETTPSLTPWPQDIPNTPWGGQ